MTAYRWHWDIEKIRQTTVADNVVDLMVRKIERLPPKTIDVLKTASCIGNSFEFETLSLVCEISADEISAVLDSAVAEGYIIPSGGIVKFSHDRIQEAAYSLIPDNERLKIHYRIGKILLERTPSDQLDEKLFAVVDLLNT